MIFWAFACSQSGTILPSICDPLKLSQGEVRARYLGCSEELLPKGHARRGDLVLENSQTRWIFRLPPVSLTEGFGGGIHLIDAAPVGHNDGILELLPMNDGSAISSEYFELTQTAENIELLVEGADQAGLWHTIRYNLRADSNHLEVFGAEEWKLTPLHGWENRFVYHNPKEDWVFALQNTDQQDRIHLSFWEEIYRDLDPASSWAEGESDGDWVANNNARLPVTNGTYQGYLPQGMLSAEKQGCVPGDPAPENPMTGSCGSLRIRAQDVQNNSLALEVITPENKIFIPKSGAKIPLDPSVERFDIWAGYAHERQTIERSAADQENNLLLYRAIPNHYLLLFEDNAFPQSSLSLPKNHLNADRIIQSAQNQIPLHTSAEQLNPDLVAASWNDGILSWPWSPKLNKPALGAAPAGLSAEELLIFSLKSNRSAAISPQWLSIAPDPVLWSKQPDYLWLEDHSDLHIFMDLLTLGIAPIPISKVNWLHVDSDASWTAARQKASSGGVAAGNGPWVELKYTDKVTLNIAAPQWMKLTHAEIWVDGELLLAESIHELPITLNAEVDSFSWATAKVYGQESTWLGERAWAISGCIIPE